MLQHRLQRFSDLKRSLGIATAVCAASIALAKGFSDLKRSLGIATPIPPELERLSKRVSVTSNGR